jgi:hypothetical protein
MYVLPLCLRHIRNEFLIKLVIHAKRRIHTYPYLASASVKLQFFSDIKK